VVVALGRVYVVVEEALQISELNTFESGIRDLACQDWVADLVLPTIAEQPCADFILSHVAPRSCPSSNRPRHRRHETPPGTTGTERQRGRGSISGHALGVGHLPGHKPRRISRKYRRLARNQDAFRSSRTIRPRISCRHKSGILLKLREEYAEPGTMDRRDSDR
jgi:hypothetical protein